MARQGSGRAWGQRPPGDLTYRGHDRRTPASWRSPRGRQFALAVALLVTVTAVVAYLAATDPRPSGIDLGALDGVLATASVTLALVAGFVSCLRWRMVGTASSLRLGAALLLLGVLVTCAVLVPFVRVTAASSSSLDELDAAIALTVIALFSVAVIAPPINTRVSATRRFLGVVTTVGILVGLMYAVPALTVFGRSRPPLTGAGETAARAVVVAVWLVLGLLATVRGLRHWSWLWTWLGLMLFGFAIAGVLEGNAVVRHDLWLTGALVVRLLALLFVLNGVGQELKLAFFDQRARLFDTRVSSEAMELQHRAEQAEREERAHEAKSALLGIEAASRTITAEYELRDALEAEIELLRHLVDQDPNEAPCEEFDVAAALSPAVVCQRADGRDVRVDIRPGVRAIGRPAMLLEIVQSLLDNARDHAPGSPVVLRGDRVGDRVLIRVEDRGPGVSRERRERIFDRGVSSSGNGRGLGLYVARRLLRDHDGDLHVESRPGGGAAFVVTVPAASLRVGSVAGAELVHHPDDGGQLEDPDPLDTEGRHQ